MLIKITNTEGDYQCIIVGHNNPVRVDKKEGMRPFMGLVSLRLPSLWITFTLALTVAALRSSSIGALTNTCRQTVLPVYNL